MDEKDVNFVREYSSRIAGIALSNALTAQTAAIGSLLQMLSRKGLITKADIAMFCNEAVDPLSRFIEMEGEDGVDHITSALRSYADGVLKLSELGVGDDAKT